MTFSAYSFLEQGRHFQWGKNITFVDLLEVILKEFKVLDDKFDSKLESYRNELHELALELITCDSFSLDDCGPPRGSAPIVGCTEQSSPTFACAAWVGSDTQDEFQTLKDTLKRVKISSEHTLNEFCQMIQRADQAVYHILTKCARNAETSLKLLSTIEPRTKISWETHEQFFLINQAQIQHLQDEYASFLINRQFDSTRSKLFRALQKNTSRLNASSLAIQSAASLSAAAKLPPTRRYRRFSNRGYYSGGSCGGYMTGPDTFDRFFCRQIPTKRRPDDGS